MLSEWQQTKLEVMQLVNSWRAASPSVSLPWDPLSLEVHKCSCLWLGNKATESINRHLNAENHQRITCASAHLEVLKGNLWFDYAWMYSNEFICHLAQSGWIWLQYKVVLLTSLIKILHKMVLPCRSGMVFKLISIPISIHLLSEIKS